MKNDSTKIVAGKRGWNFKHLQTFPCNQNQVMLEMKSFDRTIVDSKNESGMQG